MKIKINKSQSILRLVTKIRQKIEINSMLIILSKSFLGLFFSTITPLIGASKTPGKKASIALVAVAQVGALSSTKRVKTPV